MKTTAATIGISRLLDYLDQVRLDDPLVGSQQPEAMYAGGGNNHPVHRISQRATQRPNLLGDVTR